MEAPVSRRVVTSRKPGKELTTNQGQIQDEAPPINITGDDEYEVGKILAYYKRFNTLSYRVTWLNRDVDLT